MLCARTLVSDNWTDGPPILYGHTGCGSEVSHGLVWAACGRVDDPAQVQARPGPGMSVGTHRVHGEAHGGPIA